jgi:hypothetical protein
MGAIDEDEAIYKIMMAEHYISIIQDSPELINLIKTHINLGSSGQVPHTNAWGAVKPLLGIIGLQINKPKEPIGDIRELTGEKIKWRYENWSCSNPFHYYQDGTKHCGDCGACGHSKGDGKHDCICPEDQTEYRGENCPKCGR